jgi:ubiquinone/menaquinone biosynthesis C-methylase UbiE
MSPTAPPTAATPNPDLGPQARFWDRMARRYAAARIADEAGYERTLARTQALLPPAARVLEIGCGTGTTALRLAPACARYRATDVSPGMIAIARDKLAAQPVPALQFVLAAADVPLAAADAPFDTVLAFNVLHLVDDLDVTLASCAAALRPSGLLICKTPCLQEMNPLIPRVALPLARLLRLAPPVHSLREADLTAALVRQGLAVVGVERHASRGRDFRPFIVARKADGCRPGGG